MLISVVSLSLKMTRWCIADPDVRKTVVRRTLYAALWVNVPDLRVALQFMQE
jgi:hypothetical protein